MLKYILELMVREGRSFLELADALDITPKELRNRLQSLENMRYIEKVAVDAGDKACILCPSAIGCEGCSSNMDFPDSYRVTEKGRRLISGKDGH